MRVWRCDVFPRSCDRVRGLGHPGACTAAARFAAANALKAAAWNKLREGRISQPPSKKQKKDAFSKLDFTSVVLQHRLLTPNAVLEYVQEKGSKKMQMWVNSKQRNLKEYIQHAVEWGSAKQASSLEQETDWGLIERLGQETCACGTSGCLWWTLASEFFERNPG